MPTNPSEYQVPYYREWYKANRAKQKENAKRNKRKQREWFESLKNGLACSLCGEDHPSAIEFHHRNPAEKEFELAAAADYGRERVLREMAKCDVVCSNCHKRIHWEEHRNEKIRE